MKVTITVRIQLSHRVHLTWTFDFQPYDSLTPLLTVLARTGLYYHSLVTNILNLTAQKDAHIKVLQEKLSDLGGVYHPRKYKSALEEFKAEEWREKQRGVLDKMNGREVFEKWRDVDEDAVLDWMAVAKTLYGWNEDPVLLFEIELM